MIIYVGNVQKDGLRFQSIRDAKEYLKKCSSGEPAEVLLASGRYYFDRTLRFDDTDYPAVYRAMDGAEVYFDGGISIDNSLVKKTTDPAVLERVIEVSARAHL